MPRCCVIWPACRRSCPTRLHPVATSILTAICCASSGRWREGHRRNSAGSRDGFEPSWDAHAASTGSSRSLVRQRPMSPAGDRRPSRTPGSRARLKPLFSAPPRGLHRKRYSLRVASLRALRWACRGPWRPSLTPGCYRGLPRRRRVGALGAGGSWRPRPMRLDRYAPERRSRTMLPGRWTDDVDRRPPVCRGTSR